MRWFLSSFLLTLLLQAGAVAAQDPQAFRVVPIPKRENGYGNFESVAFNTKAEFDSFIAGTSKQPGWNSRQVFVDALQNAGIDFTRESLVLLRHDEGSGSVQVTFETPTLLGRKLVCQIRGKALTGGGTMDMAYYCFAVVVSRSAVSEVELRAVKGGFKERELPPIVFPIRPPEKDQSAKPAEQSDPAAKNKEEAIARLFGLVNELKSEPDTPAAALLHSEIADVLWRFDEPGARVIFRLAFDSVRQMKTDSSSSLDAEAKSKALREARRRGSALKTILKRYGLHDQKGAQAWLQDLENDQQTDAKNPNKGSRMSLAQGELLAELASGLVRQDVREAQRLGMLSLTAESIPPSFTGLLMSMRSVDRTLSDGLFRQALLAMRANGLRYDSTLVSLTNYEFFANGRPFPDASGVDVSLLTQYFVDAANAQSARLRSGALTSDEQASLGSLYSFLSNRALPLVASNSPERLALLQTNLAEISRGLTSEQRQQADTLASINQQRAQAGDAKNDDIDAQLRRAEQEKNPATRDVLFQNLALSLMRSQAEKALDVARKIDDLELRAQTEDNVYLVMMEDAFRGNGIELARNIALKMNDVGAKAKWLAEIAIKKSRRTKDATATANSLSEAYDVAAKGENNAAKVDALLYIAQQFLTVDRERGFNILSEALAAANRIDPKPQPPLKGADGTMRVISITVVNGKERSPAFKPTLASIDFNEVVDFAKTDYFQTNALGDRLQNHLLRSKYSIAVARSVLGVPREGPAYERSFTDMFLN